MTQLPSAHFLSLSSSCRKLPFSCSVSGTEPFCTPFSSAPHHPRASISTHKIFQLHNQFFNPFRNESWVNPFVAIFQPLCLFLRPLHFHLQFFQLHRHSLNLLWKRLQKGEEKKAKTKQTNKKPRKYTPASKPEDIPAVTVTINFFAGLLKKISIPLSPAISSMAFEIKFPILLAIHLGTTYSGLMLVCGIFFHPSPLLFFNPFKPLTLDRRGKQGCGGKGAMSLLDYFLLIRGVEVLGASLIIAVRISNCFWFLCTDYITNGDQEQPATHHQQPRVLGPQHLYTLWKVPRIPNVT